MTSPQTGNLGTVNRAAKGTWPIAGGRCHPDDLKVIDLAALHAGKKRAHFIVDAALNEARRVLAAQAAVDHEVPA